MHRTIPCYHKGVKSQELKHVVSFLAPAASYSRQDLYAAFKQAWPRYAPSSYSWLLAALLSQRVLYRNGSNRYSQKPASRTLIGYCPSKIDGEISALFSKHLPRVPYVLFHSASLNAWLNHLIAHDTIVVEVASDSLEEVFDVLHRSFKAAAVLFDPTVEERLLYQKPVTIVLLPLRSRSPFCDGPGKFCIEKLWVDIQKEPVLASFCIEGVSAMLSALESTGTFDMNALRKYARVRGVSSDFLS